MLSPGVSAIPLRGTPRTGVIPYLNFRQANKKTSVKFINVLTEGLVIAAPISPPRELGPIAERIIDLVAGKHYPKRIRKALTNGERKGFQFHGTYIPRCYDGICNLKIRIDSCKYLRSSA